MTCSVLCFYVNVCLYTVLTALRILPLGARVFFLLGVLRLSLCLFTSHAMHTFLVMSKATIHTIYSDIYSEILASIYSKKLFCPDTLVCGKIAHDVIHLCFKTEGYEI